MIRQLMSLSAASALSITVLGGCGSPDGESALSATSTSRGLVIRSDRGLSVKDIEDTVNLYRADLGGDNNLNTPGTQPEGHREINWDGVPANLSAPQLFPGDFFSTRGLLVATPGKRLQVSSKASEFELVEYGNINKQLPKLFQTFSPEKLFTSLSSTEMDVTFTVPGSLEKATVSGFGAIFTDVDLPRVSKLDYFDIHGRLLASVPVPAVPNANESLSFVGVQFKDGRKIAKVRITSGNTRLGSSESSHLSDRVVLDDFLYAEPKAAK